jgi:condensin complex subunit 2
VVLISAQFFPDLNDLDDLDICPSLKNFELFSSDKLMDLPFLKLQSENIDAELDDYLFADRTMPAATFPDDGGFGDFGGDDGGGFGDDDFHAATDAAFGKGGDNWADGSIMGDNDATDGQGFEALTDIKGAPGRFVMALSSKEGENILSYFDERGGKNWAGPEHWRIQRIKKGTPKSPRSTNDSGRTRCSRVKETAEREGTI